MSAENPLRTLLIDCRIALRRAPAGDQTSALATRIDATIREIDRGQLASITPVADDSPLGKSGSQQVALAWQTACRGLMLTEPQMYSALRDKVMGLLDQRELRDPDQELLTAEAETKRLHTEMSSLRTRMNEMLLRAGQAQAALSVLREALGEAAQEMPDAESFREAQALALAQIAWLHARRVESAAGGSAHAAENGPMPGPDLLQAVAEGRRQFSPAQREWVVGEALGVTGWSLTPLELLDKGDAWLASTLLGGAPTQA